MLLRTLVVMLVIEGLPSPLKADFDIAHEPAVHLGISENIDIVEPSAEPKVSLPCKNGQCILYVSKERGGVECLWSRRVTGSDHMFLEQMARDLIDGVRRASANNQSFAYFPDNAGCLSVVFESILDLGLERIRHRRGIWVASGLPKKSPKLCFLIAIKKSGALGGDSRICCHFSSVSGDFGDAPHLLARLPQSPSEASNRDGGEGSYRDTRGVKGFVDLNGEEWRKVICGAVFLAGLGLFAYFASRAG